MLPAPSWLPPATPVSPRTPISQYCVFATQSPVLTWGSTAVLVNALTRSTTLCCAPDPATVGVTPMWNERFCQNTSLDSSGSDTTLQDAWPAGQTVLPLITARISAL